MLFIFVPAVSLSMRKQQTALSHEIKWIHYHVNAIKPPVWSSRVIYPQRDQPFMISYSPSTELVPHLLSSNNNLPIWG